MCKLDISRIFIFFIESEMRMKKSAGEECVMKFLGSREGFHRVCSIYDSSCDYAPRIGSLGLHFSYHHIVEEIVEVVESIEKSLDFDIDFENFD